MPRLAEIRARFDEAAEGAWMLEQIRAWYPFCRSITGQGLRDTLDAIGTHLPLERCALPTGTPVFDWTIPREWNVREAYLADTQGHRVVDFAHHNLHLMGYSVPVRKRVSREELEQHLHSLPEQPDAIPYRTSYYKEDWAFCVTQRQRDELKDSAYDVVIDAALEDGVMDYGECLLPGTSPDEILLSAHACHPSLANDNLSAIAVAMSVARALKDAGLRHGLRLLFAPGTIGAIAWLSQNADHARARLKHGLVLACVGDAAPFKYKQSRRGDAAIDRAAALALRGEGTVTPFIPYGYDERQYGSPGFNLPVGCFMRSGPGGFPEYHTSGDNPDLLSAAALGGAARKIIEIIEVLEGDGCYRNLCPHGEPQLGRRGLYGMTGGLANRKAAEMGMLWVLNYSDGTHSLMDIALRSGIAFPDIRAAADLLFDAGLLEPAGEACA